jgi:hypothetical protein
LYAELLDRFEKLGPLSEQILLGLGEIRTYAAESRSRFTVTMVAPPTSAATPRTERKNTAKREGPLRAGAIRMLEACATFEKRGLTRSQIAALAKIKQGPTFSTYMSELRQAGFIDERSGRCYATPAGVAFLPVVPPKPRKPEEIISRWRGEFRAGAQRMLDIIVAAYPNPVSRAEISSGSQILPGPTFSTYLSELKRAELVTESSDGLYAVVLDLVS